MPVHPVINASLAAKTDGLPDHAYPIAEARRRKKARYENKVSPIPVAFVSDLLIEAGDRSIPVRLYRPRVTASTPTVLYFHGGGFVALDLDTHDDICRQLCHFGRISVLSIAYRLAPEHPFPAAVQDGVSVVEWLAEHAFTIGCDGTNLGVAGDSAGGCVAAATTIATRLAGLSSIRAQLLFYPVLDHYSASTKSYELFGTGYGLTADAMRWFWDQYLQDPCDVLDPLASPFQVLDPASMPALKLVTAEYDVLRDEGELFAQKLSKAGVSVELKRVQGMTHGFLKWADQIPEVAEVIAHSAEWMGRALNQEWD